MSPTKVATFEFPEVRVVEASAGSGKTYALAKRYIQLLLNPALHLEQTPIRQVLAITFTNKAAFEMKERILELLKKIAFQKLSAKEFEYIVGPLGINSQQAAEKAFWVMEDIVRHYNFFQVQTIDKFINAILSGCAFKIGLTANFRIRTNAAQYLEHSLDQLIDKAHGDKAVRKSFEQFLHNYLYLENRTGWFPKRDMLSIITNLFGHNNSYGTPFMASDIEAKDIIKKKREILQNIQTLQGHLPEAVNKGFVKSLEKFLANNTSSFDIDNISDYFAREEFPINKGAKLDAKTNRLWQKIRWELEKLCEEEAYSLFNPYIHIYSQVINELVPLAAKDDVLFLEQLNQRAGNLFDEDYVTVEELYYRLATRFHHYLVDEFQDTSRLQWMNLTKMVEEALSTGGSLFYVGDRKQAIYGFRGGDVNLFDDIQKEFHPFNIQIEHLTKNWRSHEEIVNFNNQIFSKENLQNFLSQRDPKKEAVSFLPADIDEICSVFADATQTFEPKKKDGYVRVDYLDIDRKQDRDEITQAKLMDLMDDLTRRYPPGDIAILTRNNRQVEEVTNWLLAENYAVKSERTSNVQENHLIQELIAFLNFLNSPIDNRNFTAFILGDIFASVSGASRDKLHEFVFSLREDLRNRQGVYVYREFRKKFPKLWNNFIDEFFKNVGLYPLYELVVSLYHKLDCLNHFPEHQGFFMHFLELVKKAEEDYSDMASFLEYFEELSGEDLYVNIEQARAIEITTVHKAKGLQWPVVVCPFLGMDVQVGSQGADYQQSYVLKHEEQYSQLLKLKQKYLKFSESLNQDYRREYLKSFVAELNNVYVSLTRSEKELYVFVPKKVGNASNPVRDLIPQTQAQHGQPFDAEEKKSPSEEFHIPLPASEYHDWIDYLKDEFHNLELITHRQKRMEGDILHFIFSHIKNIKNGDASVVVDQAITQARYTFPLITNWTQYKTRILKALNNKKIKAFFELDEGEVVTEKDIVNQYGHTRRIDRLIITAKEVWIVDFKSGGQKQEEYHEQVHEYMKVIGNIYPKRKVRGCLVYIDELTVEEVHG